MAAGHIGRRDAPLLCAIICAGGGDHRLAGATRRAAFAARAATGRRAAASGHVRPVGMCSQSTSSVAVQVRSLWGQLPGAPRQASTHRWPMRASASGAAGSSLTSPPGCLEPARSRLGLKKLNEERVGVHGGLVPDRSAGVTCQPPSILSGPCPLRCAFTPTRTSSTSPTVRSRLTGSRTGRCLSMRYSLPRPSLPLTT
jgi:hypothetical protein